ncbi:hypothetical protein BO99DRAFT_252615 [Aspergillus violaceofuscus CBS 115571]|uniref:Uncharacterized protein n=1 Tax=Aspergillus violaceofuscus (strain CBS 115571) TaxID=1450538 RepID=A0A2V5GW88_ASPV1|nr:hypothetical protein BO99DRAFT_252615 [Aspergillus violaceofuscus CBS 115571]
MHIGQIHRHVIDRIKSRFLRSIFPNASQICCPHLLLVTQYFTPHPPFPNPVLHAASLSLLSLSLSLSSHRRQVPSYQNALNWYWSPIHANSAGPSAQSGEKKTLVEWPIYALDRYMDSSCIFPPISFDDVEIGILATVAIEKPPQKNLGCPFSGKARGAKLAATTF